MDGLTPEELIPGEYYQCQEEEGFVMIFQFKEQSKIDPMRPITRHCITSEGKYSQNSPIWISDRNCRFATSEEIKLLFNEIEENKKFLDKDQDDLTLSDFYHGQEFRCNIMGTPSKGLVSIDENGKIYLCQNQVEGTHIQEKFGYDYSWQITIIDDQHMENEKNKLALRDFNIEVENLQLEKPKEIQGMRFNTTLQLTLIPGPSGLYFDHAYNKTKNVIREKKLYLSIDGLDDPSDERVIMMHADSMSFIGFSKLTGSPIFKMLEDGTESLINLPEEIILLGGTINAIQPEHINEHIDLCWLNLS